MTMPSTNERADSWKSHSVHVATEQGDRDVWGWVSPSVPGLAITAAMRSASARDLRRRFGVNQLYVLTHLGSGERLNVPRDPVAGYFGTFDAATACALALSAHCDWTQATELVRERYAAVANSALGQFDLRGGSR
jgi:hypothetical protein